MSYSDGEGFILTRIRTLTNFDANNTSRSNWKVLNRGTSTVGVSAIVRPGGFTRRWGTTTIVFTRWRTVIEVWQRYKDDSTTQTDLQARAQQIVDEFDARRFLGDTTGKVQDAYVTEGREPVEMWVRGGNGPAWLMEELVCEWTEEAAITFAE